MAKNETTLKNYCLEMMGITQWQRRTLSKALHCDYLILLDLKSHSLPLANDLKQMLDRIVQALDWPTETIIDALASELSRLPTQIEQKVQQYQAKKIMLFTSLSNTSLDAITQTFVIVPSLSTLLQDKVAKKQAWEKMQSLIN